MKADKALNKLDITYDLIEQDKPTKGCEEAAEARGLETSQIVKSLIVESKGEKYHVLLQGDRELSEKKFGSEYRMVPPKEAEKITGFEPGTVHPFSTELNHVVDQRIFEKEIISHTTGETRKAVKLNSEKFRQALQKSDFQVNIKDVVVSNQRDYKEVMETGLKEEDAKFIVEKGYRKQFLNHIHDYSSKNLLDFFKSINREEVSYEEGLARQVLDRSENETHMQRLVETYSRKGSLPEEENGFDLKGEVDKVLEENQEALEDLKNGKDSALNFLIGKLMENTNGKADPGKARNLIEEKV